MVNGRDDDEMRGLNDDTPSDDGGGVATQTNGVHPTGQETGPRGSVGDFAGLAMGNQQGGSLPKMLVTFPEDIAEWGPLADLSTRQASAMVVLAAEDYALNSGFVPWQRINWMIANLSVSIEGKARKQFMQVLGAVRDSNFVSGVMDRFGGGMGFNRKDDDQRRPG